MDTALSDTMKQLEDTKMQLQQSQEEVHQLQGQCAVLENEKKQQELQMQVGLD